jgi:hypothetical protein
MKRYGQGNITKLPVWAQDHIERLANEKARLKALVEEMAFKVGDTNVALVYGIEDRPLPKDSVVRFRPRLGSRDYFDVRLDDGRLTINASDLLSISPAASNHIQLYLPRKETK